MSTELNNIQARRSTAAAFIHAIPAIALISGYLWLAIGVASWAFASTFFGGSTVIMAAAFVLLAPGGIYLTSSQAKLAIDAERSSDN